MSEEFERKRQEKVANFKINFGDAITPEEKEISSNTVQGDDTAPSAQANNNAVPSEFQDITSGESNDNDDSELNSYSGPPEKGKDIKNIDKKSLRKAKRTDKKRAKIKAKKNRIIFRVVWITMILFVSIMIGEFLMVGVNDVLGVGREEGKATITVPANADIDKITDILYQNHVINTKWSLSSLPRSIGFRYFFRIYRCGECRICFLHQ